MVFLFSEAATMAIEFGNFDCNEVNIGTHGFGNLLNIVTPVYQFFYIIIGEHELSGNRLASYSILFSRISKRLNSWKPPARIASSRCKRW